MKRTFVDRKKRLAAIGLLLLVALTVLTLGSAGVAAGGPPEPRELLGLREAPDMPVRSIILRRNFPDHPVGGRPGRGEPGGGGCDKDVDLTSTLSGVVAVAAQDNGICTSADIDTYVNTVDGDTYVVQGGGEEAAFTVTHIDANGNPTLIDQVAWRQKNTYTPDAKAFVQGGRNYIVLSLERLSIGNAACGVVFVDVTDTRGSNPPLPPIVHQEIGGDWCDVHNSFVENVDGEGRYVYLTADGPNDMRVLDIANIATTDPPEIGRYTAPTANNDNYVHDITVLDHGGSVGRRAYLAYWDSGLVILNAADVTPGTNPAPVVGPNVIDPAGFLSHHAWASQDGSLVFNQDEFLNSSGDEPVQMWNVSNPASPTYVDGLALGPDVPVNPAHNLEIRNDINPNRLYVGWYKLGLQAWDFTSAGFDRSANPAPRTAVQYHQAQTESADDVYSGAWGVRLANIGSNLYIFQSDRNYGLIVDREGTPPPPGNIAGTVTDSSSGNPIQGATVTADTGESDTTDANGDYTLSNVSAGDRTVTASAAGYVTQQQQTTVPSDGIATLNFALDPEQTGGTGTIKGTLTDANTGARLGGVLVTTDTGQAATTNNGGKYTIQNVPEGNRTVTASKSGYVTQQQPATVTAGQTTTVNFALVPQ
jgi:hypothetical protein